MTHTVRRLAREKHCLVNIRRNSAPSEVSRESTMPHEHDVIRLRLLFTARSTTLDMTTVIVDADDRTLVQRSKHYFLVALVSHKYYRTNPSSIREIRG